MPDMLVKLYKIPPLGEAIEHCQRDHIRIERARAPEKARTVAWALEHFSYWVSEIEASFARTPVSCHLAVREQQIVGFACHDAFAPNFFGPTGVAENERGRGIGTALLLSSLHAQRAQGYAYAVIGGVGPVEYYQNVVGASVIEGSDPGAYENLLV